MRDKNRPRCLKILIQAVTRGATEMRLTVLLFSAYVALARARQPLRHDLQRLSHLLKLDAEIVSFGFQLRCLFACPFDVLVELLSRFVSFSGALDEGGFGNFGTLALMVCGISKEVAVMGNHSLFLPQGVECGLETFRNAFGRQSLKTVIRQSELWFERRIPPPPLRIQQRGRFVVCSVEGGVPCGEG
jgi:hypothetical protein